MIHKSVYKRVFIVAGCRMNDHTLRLIDNKQVVVLKDYIKRNILRLNLQRYGLKRKILHPILYFQLIKFAVLKHLEPIGSITVIDKVLSLTYVENTGAAFGSFSGYTRVLSVFTALVLIVGLIYLLSGRLHSQVVSCGLTLIISGGAANLIDRVGREFVIDYIDPLFIKFAVFNFADILVTVGAFIVIIYLLYDIIKDSKTDKAKK